ncbi:hypothetical protein ACFQ61_02085 [Streptomyces sp. NPDC056500]|uniref:hypothetical protein n=1 Tax=Streptomyces sp. NPDC056500 TaxID=3345840 RepID=UPI0036759C05
MFPRPHYTSEAIGQAAYEAYAAAVGHTSVRGEPLPTWDEQAQPIRNAWQLAAEAVRGKVRAELG